MPPRKTKADPFAEDESPVENTPATKENENVTVEDKAVEISATLKAGTGFDAPWIVVRGGSAAEVNDVLVDPDLKELLGTTAKASVYFGEQMPAGSAKPVSGGRPNGGGRGTPEWAEGVTPPTCEHGLDRQPVQGTKNGKLWKAWMCPKPKGESCKPQWVD